MRRFHRPSHRPLFIVMPCVAIIIGCWAGHRFNIPMIVLVSVVGWTLLMWRSALWWSGLVVLGLVLGCMRTNIYDQQLAYLTDHIGINVVVSAQVVTDPVTDEHHRTTVQIGHLYYRGRAVPGTIRLSGYNLRLQRGFSVVVSGKLHPGYATWIGELSYPKLLVTDDRLSILERLRQRFFQGMRTAVPDPEAAFGLGLLVGVGAIIPKPLQLQLTRVGLSHLTAVSGYNLTIIIRLVMRLLRRLGPNVVMVFSLWLIAGFIVIAGGSASIVRAGAVASLSLIATRSGLRIQPVVLIAFAAAGTVLYNPGYLHDAGWALSFLAFYGILVVAPTVMNRFGEPRFALGVMLVETLAAEVMTLPYVMVQFHQVSLIGIAANLIIKPVIPLAMALAALAASAGAWFGVLVDPFGGGATIVLHLILATIASFAALPWAQVELQLSIVGAVAIYCVIGSVTYLMVRRSASQPQFGILKPDRSNQNVRTLKMALDQTPEGDQRRSSRRIIH